jgi:hypothetical protein
MLMLPELAVALRTELKNQLIDYRDDVVLLSTWSKARTSRAESYVSVLGDALARPLEIALWQKGAWGLAIQERERLGGEQATQADIFTEGALWLFESITLPTTVRQRFDLPLETRIVGRVLLPLSGPGLALGFVMRTGGRKSVPFLRLLPELHPGDFLADPHVNFIAARRYVESHATEVTPWGDRARGGRVLSVPGE